MVEGIGCLCIPFPPVYLLSFVLLLDHILINIRDFYFLYGNSEFFLSYPPLRSVTPPSPSSPFFSQFCPLFSRPFYLFSLSPFSFLSSSDSYNHSPPTIYLSFLLSFPSISSSSMKSLEITFWNRSCIYVLRWPQRHPCSHHSLHSIIPIQTVSR